jgi:hypothetical protein
MPGVPQVTVVHGHDGWQVPATVPPLQQMFPPVQLVASQTQSPFAVQTGVSPPHLATH